MATTTRIYKVPAEPKDKSGAAPSYTKHFLVDAASQAQAERHVAKKYVGAAEVAKPRDVAEMIGHGVVLETAKEDA